MGWTVKRRLRGLSPVVSGWSAGAAVVPAASLPLNTSHHPISRTVFSSLKVDFGETSDLSGKVRVEKEWR